MPKPPLPLYLDDVVELRKAHPCGGDTWRIVRLGADIGVRCAKCGRRVLIGRSDLERVLVVTNAFRAAAVLPLLVIGESVAAAYVVNFLVAAITVFFVPAESATIPAIVRRRDLLVANSLFTFTFNGAFLVGFIILAPIVIALSGYQALFVVVGAMFAGAALLCLTAPTVAPVMRDRRVAVD